MIESVSVGLSHSIARSKLGYVYTWGCNKYGQVSPEPLEKIAQPTLIEIDKQKIKALQAVAGIRCSYILLDSFTIVSLGTSSSSSSQKNTVFSPI